MAVKKRERHRKVGRPPKPLDEARRNRLTITLTDGELERIRAIADAQGLPLGTVVHELVARSLSRRRRA